MRKHIYREYDIRGVADRDLTSPVVRGIGQGLGEVDRVLDTARAKFGAGSSGAHA